MKTKLWEAPYLPNVECKVCSGKLHISQMYSIELLMGGPYLPNVQLNINYGTSHISSMYHVKLDFGGAISP